MVGKHGVQGRPVLKLAAGPVHQDPLAASSDQGIVRWRTTLKKADLKGIRLHDLRQIFASGLIASGCDVVTVQRALGHAKATTTLDTYSHLWPTAEDRTRKAADAMLAEAMAVPKDSSRTQAGS